MFAVIKRSPAWVSGLCLDWVSIKVPSDSRLRITKPAKGSPGGFGKFRKP